VTTKPAPKIDFNTLADFALGNLAPESALIVIRELERSPQASRDLEFILKLIAYFDYRLDTLPAAQQAADRSLSGP